MDVASAPTLQVIGLSKTYGPVKALAGVDLILHEGEVRALLGKNGAGKSTLVNLVSGSEKPDHDGGKIFLAGELVTWDNPAAARAGGIAVVRQEFSLVPGLSVAENITLGHWPTRGKSFKFIDTGQTEEIAKRAIATLGENLPLWREVGKLSLAQRQLVEIAKALAFDPQVLILDEPTSALNAREASALLALVRRLAAQGVTVIFVSHRMQEIPRVADSLTVLRDGVEVATLDVKDASTQRVAEMISGESVKVGEAFAPRDFRTAEVVLSVRGLGKQNFLYDISFNLHKGEILGIAGLLGSGRSEILQSIFGARSDFQGEVLVFGKKLARRRPSSMLSKGIGLTSEDRREAGIFPLLGVGENMVITARGRILAGRWIKRRAEAKVISDQISELAISTASPNKLIGSLSGGNQQKAVIGRLLIAKMKILLLDEPTRGIDVHAKTQIYQLIRKLAGQGVSSIFVSSELEELSQVCDRVLVLRNGTIAEEVLGEQTSAENLLVLTMKES